MLTVFNQPRAAITKTIALAQPGPAPLISRGDEARGQPNVQTENSFPIL